MERRTFLKKLGVGAGALSVPAAGSLAIQNNKLQEHREMLSRRLEEAERTIEQLKKDHKKTVKAAAVVTAVLVGVDLSLLL